MNEDIKRLNDRMSELEDKLHAIAMELFKSASGMEVAVDGDIPLIKELDQRLEVLENELRELKNKNPKWEE